MLILSRKERESVLVGDNIEITICRVSGGRVKLGFRAPHDVSIRRGELTPFVGLSEEEAGESEWVEHECHGA